jgi:hypothetical protein
VTARRRDNTGNSCPFLVVFSRRLPEADLCSSEEKLAPLNSVAAESPDHRDFNA